MHEDSKRPPEATSRRKSGPAPVRVIVTRENLAIVGPAVPFLEDLFRYRSFAFQPGGACGHARQEGEVHMADRDLKGRLVFPAGLLSRCRAALEVRGHAVEVDDERTFGRRFRVS